MEPTSRVDAPGLTRGGVLCVAGDDRADFNTVVHTREQYEEYGPSIVRHNKMCFSGITL